MVSIQEQIVATATWQHVPSNNLVGKNPVKNVKNFPLFTDEKRIHIVDFTAKHGSDMRFSCPECGTLDVFFRNHISKESIIGQCLDCGNIWKDVI